jgi:hypothetical protein
MTPQNNKVFDSFKRLKVLQDVIVICTEDEERMHSASYSKK